ncbi:MAG: ArnT family glycosyltransferase [Phycisphaerae bacterium]
MPWIAVFVVAAGLRIARLDVTPPGLNQDEAANAWNAYCLLKTGRDQVGVVWPVFYSRCLGFNRSTLYLYVLLPFQAVGGLNVWTTRLPAAVGGVVAVWLIHIIGVRLWDRRVGLTAAAVLAVNPWHVQLGRWGHEASLGPMLVLLPIALLLWANMPPLDDDRRQPRPRRAAVAGLVAGVCCYGYPAVRLFLPAFFLAVGAVAARRIIAGPSRKRSAQAVAAFALGWGVTFGPLAWQHVAHPDRIGKRAHWVWAPDDVWTTKLLKAAQRYPPHFGIDFLFRRGDPIDIQSPPDAGQFHWYMLVFLPIGAIAVARRLPESSAARIILIWVLLYPAGDVLHDAPGMHALRSAPGLGGLVLLAAVGAVAAYDGLLRLRRPWLARAGVAVAAVVVAASNVRYFATYYGDYARRGRVYHGFQTDLVEACAYLKPRMEHIDAVFCTVNGMTQPYIVTLVALDYAPSRWFHDVRDVHTRRDGVDNTRPSLGDLYTRYGKMNFLYDPARPPAELTRLAGNGREDRVVYIVRPHELPGVPLPVHKIRRPDGKVVLWICDQRL